MIDLISTFQIRTKQYVKHFDISQGRINKSLREKNPPTTEKRLIQEYLWRSIDDALRPRSFGKDRVSGICVIMDPTFLGLYNCAFGCNGRWIQDKILEMVEEIEKDPSKSKEYRKIFREQSYERYL